MFSAHFDTLLMSYSFLVFPVPDLFVNPSSDRLRGLPNDDQRLEDGCAYNLRHRLLDCRPFCQCFPFRSRRQFTTTIWVSSALTRLFMFTRFVFKAMPAKITFLLLLFVLWFWQNCLKSCHVLSNPVKFCPMLSNFVKSCQFLSNPVKFCQIL